MEIELFSKLNALDKKEKLDSAETESYKLYRQQAKLSPLSSILVGTQYERMTLQTLSDIISFNQALLNLLSDNGVTTIAQLLDLDRFDTLAMRGFGLGKWVKTMEYREAIVRMVKPEFLTDKQEPLSTILIQQVDDNAIEEFKNQPIAEVLLADVQCLINNRLWKPLYSKGITRLVEIFDIHENERIPGAGQKFWELLRELKSDVRNNQDQWVLQAERAKETRTPITFPTEDIEGSLSYRLHYAAKEMYSKMEGNPLLVNNRTLETKDFFNYRYVENLTEEKLADIYRDKYRRDSSRRESFRNFEKKIIAQLKGSPIDDTFPGLTFQRSLVEEVKQLASDLVWHPLKELERDYNIPLDDFLNVNIFKDFTDLELYGKEPDFILVPPRKKGEIDIVLACVLDLLKEKVIPVSYGDIIDARNITVDSWQATLVQSLLETNTSIQRVCVDGEYLYQIAYTELPSQGCKIARIIWEEKKELTHDEIQNIHMKKEPGGRRLNFGSKNLNCFPDIVTPAANGRITYNNGFVRKYSRKDLIELATQYGEEHDSFTLDDFISVVKEMGMSVSRTNLHTYLLTICSNHRKDKYTYKLLSKITDDDTDFKKKRSYGIKHQFIIKSIEILEKKGSSMMPLKVLNEEVFTALNYHDDNIKYRNYLGEYSLPQNDPNAENALFLTEEQDGETMISYNAAAVETGLYDLKRIGLIDKRPGYYQKMIALVVAHLKDSANNECSLADASDICQKVIPENLSSSSFYKVFSADRLIEYTKEIERVTHADGTEWLRLKIEEIQPASYTTSIGQTENTAEEPLMKAIERPQMPQRPLVDFEKIEKDMVAELQFYKRLYWDGSSTSFEDSVAQFVKFIKESEDRNIRDIISKDIFEFWNYRIDKYDLYSFIEHLSLYYEALVRGIYMRNNPHSEKPRTNGLVETMNLMRETGFWADAAREQGVTGFLKIFKDLKYKRNSVAHGVDLELDQVTMAMTVTNYIALYIYTVTKFLKKQ